MRLPFWIVLTTIICVAEPSLAQSNTEPPFWPPGYEEAEQWSDWRGGGYNREAWCAEFARAKFANRPYRIAGTNEEERFEQPQLRMGVQRRYYCKVVFAPYPSRTAPASRRSAH